MANQSMNQVLVPAVVSGGEPIPSGIPEDGLIAVPWEPVGLPLEFSLSNLSKSYTIILFCLKLRISITTKLIEFSLLGKLLIVIRKIIEYFIFRFKPAVSWWFKAIFFCPYLAEDKVQRRNRLYNKNSKHFVSN